MYLLPTFKYLAPSSLEGFLKLLDKNGKDFKVLAGGTDLIINLKKEEIQPKYVIDITKIPDLKLLRDAGNKIIIGSTVTYSDLLESPLISKEAPFLIEAAVTVGAVQIRNSVTLGGNIANASPAADMIPPLIALGAKVKIINPKQEREIPLEELFLGPYKTKLSPVDLITEISFSKIPPRTGTCFLKVGRRNALAISRLSVAVTLTLNSQGKIESASIVPGAVTPVPIRIRKAEDLLCGNTPGKELFEQAGKIVSEEVVGITGPRYSTVYKEPVLFNLVKRSLILAAERCK